MLSGVSEDPYAPLAARVEDAVLHAPGALAPALRSAIAGRPADEHDRLDGELAAFVHTVARHAYRTTDEQVAGLVERISEDGVLEATLAAATGAARVRLDAALRALEDQ